MKNLKLVVLAMSVLFIFSCKKEKQTIECKDIDGNVYKTVTIGTQVWMAENLKTKRYNDGSSIPTGLNNTSWENTTTGAYSIYNDNGANENETYGKLYNWYAVYTGKLAPAGWHVPTDAEWTTLTTYLGGESVAGGKMKSTSALWITPNTDSNNSSGFSGLPYGYRLFYDGSYGGFGRYGYWWSSTENAVSKAWCRYLDHSFPRAFRMNEFKTGGFSVRCIRD